MPSSAELRQIAHQLRNLLQRVANRVEFLQTAETSHEREEHAQRLLQHVDEAAAVIAQLDGLAAPLEARRR